jgi:hypothetical protein
VPDWLLDNPRHWPAREEEIRVLTELMRNPETRRRMLKVADEYARLAELAEQRANEKKNDSPSRPRGRSRTS